MKNFQIFLFILSALSFSRSSYATIQVAPANGGSISGSQTTGGTLYYLAFYNNLPTLPYVALPAFIQGFTPLNLQNDVIQVNVSTTIPIQLTASQTAVVTFFAYPKSNPLRQAPIAQVNGAPCDVNNPSCVALNFPSPTGGGGNSYYYGAIYPNNGSSVKIGFNLNNICNDSSTSGSSPPMCQGAIVSPQSGVSSPYWTLQLNFSISAVDNSHLTSLTQPTVIDSMSAPLNFSFQSGASTFTCPTSAVLNQSYFPGDGRIFLDTTVGFQLTPPNNQGAPLSLLHVVGKLNGGTPTADATFNNQGVNDLVVSTPVGSQTASVGGFQNSEDPPDEKKYMLSFLAQDAAGIFVGPDPTVCTMGPVESAPIQGFLPSDDKNCFIATAVYGSTESPPVQWLREFRDQVLMKYSFGRDFIDWYYHWSPPAAHWLQENPFYRLPVLLVLLPVQVIAWLWVHLTLVEGLLILLGGIGMGRLIRWKLRKMSQGNEA